MDVVEPWSRELQKELDEPELWSIESLAAEQRHVLLPSQQNEIYRALRSHSVNFESAVWSGKGSSTVLQLNNRKYALQISWNFDAKRQVHVWTGHRNPGPELPGERFEALGWKAMATIAERWAKDVAEDQRERALPVTMSAEVATVQADRLLTVRLNGLPSLHDFEFSLRAPDGRPRMVLLIGENGTGKTTLLRAIALAVCTKTDANVLLSQPLGQILGVESQQGTIEIDYLDDEGNEQVRKVRIVRSGPREEVDQESGKFPHLFAYASGIGRSVESAEVPTSKDYRQYQSVKALFDYNTALANPELVLRRLRDSRPKEFPDILASWVQALGLPSGSEIALPPSGGVEVRQPDRSPIPLQSLADGYRLTLAWLLDLYAWAAAAGQPHVGHLSGLLLVDEIERHLHPSMQSTVL